LNRLPGDSELASYVRLGDALTDQLFHELATLGAKPSCQDRVLDGLRSDLLDTAEDLDAV